MKKKYWISGGVVAAALVALLTVPVVNVIERVIANRPSLIGRRQRSTTHQVNIRLGSQSIR